MLKETLVYTRDTLMANKPLKITLDNQHIFYDDRSPGNDYCPLIWDDENERLYIIRTNQSNPYSQCGFPIETTCVDYDDIQQIACYDNLATIQGLAILEKMSEADKKTFNEFLQKNSTSIGIIARPYNKDK